MSTRLKEKIERIEELFERLAFQSTKGTPIIVEGPNDIDTLRKLALSGPIIAAKTRKSFLALVAEIEKMDLEEVILLMDLYHSQKYTPLQRVTYIDVVVKALEHLWPNTVIQRLTADCSKKHLIEPLWLLNKNKILLDIENTLKKINSFQGKHYKESH